MAPVAGVPGQWGQLAGQPDPDAVSGEAQPAASAESVPEKAAEPARRRAGTGVERDQAVKPEEDEPTVATAAAQVSTAAEPDPAPAKAPAPRAEKTSSGDTTVTPEATSASAARSETEPAAKAAPVPQAVDRDDEPSDEGEPAADVAIVAPRSVVPVTSPPSNGNRPVWNRVVGASMRMRNRRTAWKLVAVRMDEPVQEMLVERLVTDQLKGHLKVALNHYVNAALLDLPETVNEAVEWAYAYQDVRGMALPASAPTSMNLEKPVVDHLARLKPQLRLVAGHGLLGQIQNYAALRLLAALEAEVAGDFEWEFQRVCLEVQQRMATPE
ncbi:hypothetical protein AB0I28_32870 [Phytomonospora sp. NPDC050363]|uniref:hypothetical protein n=1 Tax=Phytomonospora sp. NPDC050363 TaxID=3155642 RepID=UPI0033C1DBE4